MSETDYDLFVCLVQLIGTAMRKTSYAEYADDVTQDLYCEICRQPSTRKFVEENEPTIRCGVVPGLFWRRARAKARAMKPKWVPLDGTTLDLVDEAANRDREMLLSVWKAADVCERIPLFREVLNAEKLGVTKRELIESHRLSERKYYSAVRRARKIFPEE
jgi:hypothetical protein